MKDRECPRVDQAPAPSTGGAGEHASVQACLDQLGDWKELESVAVDLLAGDVAHPLKCQVGEQTVAAKNGLLRWAVNGERPSARAQWAALARNSRDPRLADRDRYVESLWDTVVKGRNQDLRRRLEMAGQVEAYRDFLFVWFLRRFELGSALRLFAARRTATLLRWGLPSALVVLTLAALRFGHLGPEGALLGLVLFTVALGATRLMVPSLPTRVTLQVLVPRLGAGVAIGYLFLAAAPDLVRLVGGWGRPAWVQLLVAAMVVTLAWLYACVHVLQRVQPELSRKALAIRAFGIVWMGVAYAAMGLPFSAPVLFSARFLAADAASTLGAGPPALHTLVLIASIALALGVVLELAWEEKPLTEPL